MIIIIYRKYIFPFSLFITFYLHGEVFDGYTLFTPLANLENGASTHLMNNDYEILHSWSHDQGPASMPYLLPDSSIIYPFRVPNPTMRLEVLGVEFSVKHGMVIFCGNIYFQMILISTIMMQSLSHRGISLSLYGKENQHKKPMIWDGKSFQTH